MVAKVLCLILLISVAYAGYIGGGTSRQSRQQDDHGYRFSYDIDNPHGAHNGRQESGDRSGNKQGTYYINDRDGRTRRVNYVADGHGFRATIDTNEPGTRTSQVAAAIYNSAFDGGDQGIGGHQQQPWAAGGYY